MSKDKERFDAVGVVRDFKQASDGNASKATFFLAVSKMMVHCIICTAAGTPPVDGRRMRVIGWWVVDDNQLLCVKVATMFPVAESHQ